MDNRLILVAGSGRSGTSLLSGILKALGGHVPQPEVNPDDSNPHGFGEPQWVVDFHAKLLRDAGVFPSDARPSAWAKTAETGRDPDVQAELEAWLRREFKHGDHVIVKDPRLLWFIPLWRRAGEAVAAPCFLTTLRHPLEVIMSKQMYYGEKWHPNNRVAGWLNTMLYTERAARGSRRALVRYDDLLTDFMSAIAKISDPLDLALIERSSPLQARAASRLVDPSLRRARATWSSLEVDDRLVELAEETYEAFDRAATKDDLDKGSTRSELDQLRQRYVDLYAFSESVAESTVFAARRDGRASRPSRGRGGGKKRPVSSLRGARRLWRRAKGKVRRTVYARAKTKVRGSGADTTGPEQTTTSAQEQQVGSP